MTRSALAADLAWLRANPGNAIHLYDLINQPAQPPRPGVPTWHHVWDPRRPGWRLTVTDPATTELRPGGGAGHH